MLLRAKVREDATALRRCCLATVGVCVSVGLTGLFTASVAATEVGSQRSSAIAMTADGAMLLVVKPTPDR